MTVTLESARAACSERTTDGSENQCKRIGASAAAVSTYRRNCRSVPFGAPSGMLLISPIVSTARSSRQD
jgi:hypothetical protein